jgi:hypothetical protein
VQWRGGDDVGVKVDDGSAVRLPLTSASTELVHLLGFVGSLVAWQSLDCMLRRLSFIYIALHKGESTVIHGKRPQSGHGLNWFSNSGDLS